ncbi:MAG: NADH:flavin oxidoreductase/NADH oxidase [Gallionellaceae bacterium]|jgi:2,4-dienoyl-CoA reductase-like NADH-dependent reductase (Old Yellow Enzyme family)
MSQLFSPIRLREVNIKNRIFMAPMCQYSADDGMPNEWHRTHYGARAAGGVGLVMVEATAVCSEGRITPYDLGLWSVQQAEAFRPITNFIKKQGATPAIQIAHAGRKAGCAQPWKGGKSISSQEGGWQPLAPSALAFSADSNMPKEMNQADIDQVAGQFADATKRALTAGFEVVEIHMAHGYLLHEFLSPLTNHRSDAYGGSFENRARLPLRVAQAVQDLWPSDKPVMVRISATDWVEGGWDLAGSIELVKQLKLIGIDHVDVSTGGLVPDAVMPVAPGFQIPFAASLRKETGMSVSTVGLITDAKHAEDILVAGQADAVSIGRELLRNPYWPLQAASSLGEDVSWPLQYLRAKI